MSKLPAPHEAQWKPGTIFTLGHSTLPIEDFLATLRAYGIQHLVDIRTVPRSRYNPQFNTETLAATLQEAGIDYTHMKALGGLRRAGPDSPNTGWRNGGFRGYADYMLTDEFQQALDKLIELSREKRTAIMCAEAVPWRCHRSLVADSLSVHGVPVIEIMSKTNYRKHKLTGFAEVHGERIIYPPEQASLL